MKIQRMADLPKERIEESPPFTYVGLDCFGPFIIVDCSCLQLSVAAVFGYG